MSNKQEVRISQLRPQPPDPYLGLVGPQIITTQTSATSPMPGSHLTNAAGPTRPKLPDPMWVKRDPRLGLDIGPKPSPPENRHDLSQIHF
jgi:hypothetical protein